MHSCGIPCPLEGRIAIVTNVGRGERWPRLVAVCLTDERQAADAEIVWSWHPDADAKLAAMIRW